MTGLPLQPYDLFMLALLLVATLFGFWKGMAWQIASIGSLVVSYLVAARYAAGLAPHLSNEAPWNRVLAMLILYMITSLAIWLLFRMVARIIDRVELRDFDRQVGALFGLSKGILLCLIITFFAVSLSESARRAILRTYSGRYMAILVARAAPALPREVREKLGQYIDEFDQKLRPARPSDPAREASPAPAPDGLDAPVPTGSPPAAAGVFSGG